SVLGAHGGLDAVSDERVNSRGQRRAHTGHALILADPTEPQPGAVDILGPVSDQRAERRSSAYSSAGVDYEALDAGKRLALNEAIATSALLETHGGRAVDASRGEPAFVFELGEQAFAFVVEGLGTKSVVARGVEEQLGIGAFDNVAYDTVAAIVNDLC